MTPSEEFNQIYITSSEVCKEYKMSRSFLLSAKRDGRLPNPIELTHGKLTLWVRKDLEPHLVQFEDRK